MITLYLNLNKMKRIGLISILMVLGIINMNAQDSIKRRMINPTSITLMTDSSIKVKGALYHLKDSSILISSSTRPEDYTMGNSDYTISEIEITDIQIIKITNRTRVRDGARIGAATGFLTGALWAYIDAQQPTTYGVEIIELPAWAPPLLGGILLAPIGAIAGAITGSIRIKIPIYGSMDNYNLNKAKLTKYTIIK